MGIKYMYNTDNFEKLEARAFSFSTVSVTVLLLETFPRLSKVTLCNICLVPNFTFYQSQ